MCLLLPPFLFNSNLLTCSRCSLILAGCLCCTALSLSIRMKRIINIRKSTNRLKKSWIVSMMRRMLRERASRRAISKPHYWSRSLPREKPNWRDQPTLGIFSCHHNVLTRPETKYQVVHQNGPIICVWIHGQYQLSVQFNKAYSRASAHENF